MTQAIERGSYARFALATPNDGDQAITIFFNFTGKGDHPDIQRSPGYYWCGPQDEGACGPYETEERALDGARAFYGYGPLAEEGNS